MIGRGNGGGARLMGAGPTLLLLGDFAGDPGDWMAVVHRLSRDFTVVTCGRWAAPHPDGWPATSVAQRADQAADLLRAHHLAPAVVVGHGAGGCIACELVAHHPGLIWLAVVFESLWLAAIEAVPVVDTDLADLRAWVPDVDRLRASGVPVTVVLADESRDGPSDATGAWLAAATGARRLYLPGGPAGLLTRPDKYVALIRDIAHDSCRELHWERSVESGGTP